MIGRDLEGRREVIREVLPIPGGPRRKKEEKLWIRLEMVWDLDIVYFLEAKWG